MSVSIKIFCEYLLTYDYDGAFDEKDLTFSTPSIEYLSEIFENTKNTTQHEFYILLSPVGELPMTMVGSSTYLLWQHNDDTYSSIKNRRFLEK